MLNWNLKSQNKNQSSAFTRNVSMGGLHHYQAFCSSHISSVPECLWNITLTLFYVPKTWRVESNAIYFNESILNVTFKILNTFSIKPSTSFCKLRNVASHRVEKLRFILCRAMSNRVIIWHKQHNAMLLSRYAYII